MQNSLYCSLAACALSLVASLSSALPLSASWKDTGQVLTCPDSLGMDNFPSALSAINGQVLASDVWPDGLKLPALQRLKLNNSGKSLTLEMLEYGDKLGSVYYFNVDPSGHFHSNLITFQVNHLFGFALALTDTFAFASSPDQNRTYIYKRDSDGFSSDKWLSPPVIERLEHPYFGSAVAASADWLAVGARDDGYFTDLKGRVFVYTRAASDWSHEPQELKPLNDNGLFGIQIRLNDNRLLVTTASWIEKKQDPSEDDMKQDVYIYDLDSSSRQWLLVNQPISLTVTEDGHTASAELLGELVVITGYDPVKKQTHLNVYQSQNGTWQLTQTFPAPAGSIDYGYTLQAADSQLLVSQRGAHPQVSVLTLDGNQLVDSGELITCPDKDGKPGFADLMAYDGHYLYLSRRGVTEQVNNYPGKVYVFERSTTDSARKILPFISRFLDINRL